MLNLAIGNRREIQSDDLDLHDCIFVIFNPLDGYDIYQVYVQNTYAIGKIEIKHC